MPNRPKSTPLREVLADNLLAVKNLRGETYAQLAKWTKLPASTLQRVGVAQNANTVETVEALAEALGIAPWALLLPDHRPDDPFVVALRASQVRELEGVREKAAAWDELQRIVRSMPAGDRGADGAGDGHGAGKASQAPRDASD